VAEEILTRRTLYEKVPKLVKIKPDIKEKEFEKMACPPWYISTKGKGEIFRIRPLQFNDGIGHYKKMLKYYFEEDIFIVNNYYMYLYENGSPTGLIILKDHCIIIN